MHAARLFSRIRFRPPAQQKPRLEASVRTLLFRLVLGCVLPAVIGSVILLGVEYKRRDAQLKNATLAAARTLVQAVDGQLELAQAVAHMLAIDRSLAERDPAGFQRHAAEVLARVGTGTYAALLDGSGHTIANTLRPYGEPLPGHDDMATLRRVFARGREAISDVFVSRLGGRPVVLVYSPVRAEGRTDFAVGIALDTAKLERLIAAEQLPAAWSASILDAAGRLAAQSPAADGQAHVPPAAPARRSMQEAPEGLMLAAATDGRAMLYAHSHSEQSDWSVAIGIPQAVRRADLARSLLPPALGLAALLAFWTVLTRRISLRISRSVRALAAPAIALATGERVPLPRPEVGEASVVADSIAQAGALLDERKSLERTLQDSERRLTLALQAGKAAVWEIDGASGRLKGTEKLAEFLGYDSGRIATLADWLSLVGEEHRQGLSTAIEQLIGGAHDDCQYEYRIRARSGRWHWFLCHGKVIERGAGGTPHIVGTYTNIDERKGGEQALRDSERRRALALAAGGSVDWEMDVASRTVRGEDKLAGMYGYSPAELKTLDDWAALIHPGDLPGIPEKIAAAIDGRTEGFRFEARLRCRDGSWRWNLAQAVVAERDSAGRALRLVGTHTDIDARKSAEAALQRLNAELERHVAERTAELERANEALLNSNLELQQFAHATAHDLQTPLRSIASFAELLQLEAQQHGSPETVEWARQVMDNARRLQTLIQELLSYTRLDTQGMPFERVDMERVLAEALGSLRELSVKAGAVVGSDPLPVVCGDRMQLCQLLQNLLENAIKYNEAKPPRVRVGCERQDDDWLFSVSDNGIGIAPRHHESIFEIFRRLHTYRQIPGTGIGLALCRRIVARHGGHIWVESQPGGGSVFFFTLPGGQP